MQLLLPVREVSEPGGVNNMEGKRLVVNNGEVTVAEQPFNTIVNGSAY